MLQRESHADKKKGLADRCGHNVPLLISSNGNKKETMNNNVPSLTGSHSWVVQHNLDKHDCPSSQKGPQMASTLLFSL